MDKNNFHENNKNDILDGRCCLGIELGSTRIKSVLINEDNEPIAEGSYKWENKLENGYWTYSLEDIWTGIQESYKSLKKDVNKKYACKLTKLVSLGVSAMMHGYLAFNGDNLLVPFRTWRNSNTAKSAEILSDLFKFNIPQRWSISHLYQALLDNEEHINKIDFITTLSGYVHWMLSGKKVIGIGDASGIFPIDFNTLNYDDSMLNSFRNLCKDKVSWDISEILPSILLAGNTAGYLSPDGAKMLDPEGELTYGAPMCPPEGDAGTGMVATNSVEKGTGNISAGTSIFSMVVLDKALKSYYRDVDIVTTPCGLPVAMIHCNNCSNDIDAWIKLFKEFTELIGIEVGYDKLYYSLFSSALEGTNKGEIISYNFQSGENILDLPRGVPMLMRSDSSTMNLSSFMRAHLFSAIACIKIGLDILKNEENIRINSLYGHGGYFKTTNAGQNLMSSALGVNIKTAKSAGEGGAWGIALLSKYILNNDLSLSEFLNEKVFKKSEITEGIIKEEDTLDFNIFFDKYKKLVAVEKLAVEKMY